MIPEMLSKGNFLTTNKNIKNVGNLELWRKCIFQNQGQE